LEFSTLKSFLTYLPLKQRGANRPPPIGKRVKCFEIENKSFQIFPEFRPKNTKAYTVTGSFNFDKMV
jgi:hypothetical protein